MVSLYQRITGAFRDLRAVGAPRTPLVTKITVNDRVLYDFDTLGRHDVHDYKTIYRDIAPKEAIITDALAYARGRVGAAGLVTLDILKEGCIEAVKSRAVEKLYPGFLEIITNATALFTMTNGDRPGETDDPTTNTVAIEWRDQFDEALLSAIGSDLQKAIGPSAIGEHFTDADVDDAAVASQVARECVTRLAEAAMPMDTSNPDDIKPSVNKTLSAAGIVDADLLPYTAAGSAAGSAPAQQEERVIGESEARAKVERIVGTFSINKADNFDPLVLDEILTAAFDDDQFISIGGVERLGGTTQDRDFFLAYVKAAPADAKSNTLVAALNALASGAVIEAPKPTPGKKIKVTDGAKPPKPPKTKGAAVPTLPTPPPPLPAGAPPPTAASDTADKSVPAGASDWGDVAKIWRENCTDTDATLAEAFGVSRGTISNIGLGKGGRATAKPLSPEMREAIRKRLEKKQQQLQYAVVLLS